MTHFLFTLGDAVFVLEMYGNVPSEHFICKTFTFSGRHLCVHLIEGELISTSHCSFLFWFNHTGIVTPISESSCNKKKQQQMRIRQKSVTKIKSYEHRVTDSIFTPSLMFILLFCLTLHILFEWLGSTDEYFIM